MRPLLAAVLLAAGALPAQAHFVWIVPADAAGNAQVIFSDSLEPDENVPITKIAATRLFVRGAEKDRPLKLEEGKDAYKVAAGGTGPAVIGGSCDYGVLQKGDAGPFRLQYHAKALVGPRGGNDRLAEPWARLPLDVVLVKGTPRAGRVLWQGRPLAEAEVTLLVPGQDKRVKAKTDAEGTFALPAAKADGAYGVMVKHVEEKAGEHNGKRYGQVRHYATLVFAAAAPREQGGAEEQEPAAGAVKADAAATKLLADARAARAIWEDFPGFSADLEVNHNGAVTRGKVVVEAGGKVKLDLADAAARAWTQRELNSLIAHRMGPPTEKETPCAFADKVTDHPLGRAIRVLNDELHSSYRIRDRQIIEVNRAMRDFRFTITVLENYWNPEKKYLPTAYVVNSWDLGSGALRNSVAHHNTWVRVGNFDLPNTLTVVTARGVQTQGSTTGKGGAAPAGGLDSWGVRFTNHKLSR